MNSAPVRAQAALIAAAKSGVSGRTPPSPSTGSAMIAAVAVDTAEVSAAASLVFTNLTDGSNGSNGCRESSSEVTDKDPNVRPWDDSSSAMNSARGSPFVYQ